MKIGKVGKNAIQANKDIKKICDEKGIHKCEVGLSGCWVSNELHPAHKHKRIWYRSCPELLSDFSQWILSCPVCHQKLEYDKKLTLETFKRLRPKTKMPKSTYKPKATQKKGNKADWMMLHRCKSCKTMLSGLLCTKCGDISI